MKLISKTFVGALALATLAVSVPASAMPASPLAPIASEASPSIGSIETVRWRRGFIHRRYFGGRPGWHRGYGRRHPIRRLLRAL